MNLLIELIAIAIICCIILCYLANKKTENPINKQSKILFLSSNMDSNANDKNIFQELEKSNIIPNYLKKDLS